VYVGGVLMPVAGEPERVVEEVGGHDQAKPLIEAMNELTAGLYNHQLGGRAREFQGDVLAEVPYMLTNDASSSFRANYSEAELSGEGWQLLATIEWEGAMMFGDGGNLYVTIPETDLRQGRFDRAIGSAQGA
jgi:hypothetical protein